MHECIDKEKKLDEISGILDKLNKSFIQIRERTEDNDINIICTSSIQTIQKALLITYKLWKDEKDATLELQKYAKEESTK